MDVLGIFSLPNWLAIVIVLITAAYIYFTWHFNYWKDQNVKTGFYVPFLGSLWTYLFTTVHDSDLESYKTLGKIWGIYEIRNPALMVADLELIKKITVKDFQYFPEGRRFPLGRKSRITRLFLFLMQDIEEWKMHRSILTPTFTSGKLRQMGNLMSECGDQMVKAFHEAIKTDAEDLDLKKKFGGHTVNVIATCCFGYKINTDDSNDPFILHANMILNQSFAVLGIAMNLMPKLVDLLDISFFPSKYITFFENIIHQVVGMRKQENYVRNDFLQLLLNAQMQEIKGELAKEKSGDDDAEQSRERLESKTLNEISRRKQVITEDAVVAHSMTFLLAGFDTTATTISLTIYLLALNPECQDKLIEEIDSAVKQHGKLTHDVIMELSYLDMVLSESLRYFPITSRMERRCKSDYKLGDIQLKEGMIIGIPVYSIHHSEEYYQNPEKFDPERFTPENKAKRNPVTYLPFGAGPRNCIGMRFALMDCKMALAKFFSEFRALPSSKTDIPMRFQPGVPFLIPKNGVHLKVEKRRN